MPGKCVFAGPALGSFASMDRHPALARLNVLLGHWVVQPKVEGLPAAWSDFTWYDGGTFLRQTSDMDPLPADAPDTWRQGSPYPIVSLIGYDDTADEFTMLYADGRGVHRVYRMTLSDREWIIWRDAPGFNQRFIGTVSAEGDRVDGRWEMSPDGVTWKVDFEITYTRKGDA